MPPSSRRESVEPLGRGSQAQRNAATVRRDNRHRCRGQRSDHLRSRAPVTRAREPRAQNPRHKPWLWALAFFPRGDPGWRVGKRVVSFYVAVGSRSRCSMREASSCIVGTRRRPPRCHMESPASKKRSRSSRGCDGKVAVRRKDRVSERMDIDRKARAPV